MDLRKITFNKFKKSANTLINYFVNEKQNELSPKEKLQRTCILDSVSIKIPIMKIIDFKKYITETYTSVDFKKNGNIFEYYTNSMLSLNSLLYVEKFLKTLLDDNNITFSSDNKHITNDGNLYVIDDIEKFRDAYSYGCYQTKTVAMYKDLETITIIKIHYEMTRNKNKYHTSRVVERYFRVYEFNLISGDFKHIGDGKGTNTIF